MTLSSWADNSCPSFARSLQNSESESQKRLSGVSHRHRVHLELTGRIRLFWGFDFANGAPQSWLARKTRRLSIYSALSSFHQAPAIFNCAWIT